MGIGAAHQSFAPLRIEAGRNTQSHHRSYLVATLFIGYRCRRQSENYHNIDNDIERVLHFYFLQCSIEMSCYDLSKAFLPFANHKQAFTFEGITLTASQVKRINAIMQTCGFYDEAGEFSYLVGLPGKSGVGGGIAAVYPLRYSVAVWSPRLNQKGNSVMGIKALELLTTQTQESIF